MKTADETVERAADKLQQLADSAAGQGGLKGKLAQPLADDAAFVRKLKPSLMKARAQGDAPTDGKPGAGTTAPSSPQLAARPKPATGSSGPNPFLVIGVALAVGLMLAKWLDWRGYAHPRD